MLGFCLTPLHLLSTGLRRFSLGPRNAPTLHNPSRSIPRALLLWIAAFTCSLFALLFRSRLSGRRFPHIPALDRSLWPPPFSRKPCIDRLHLFTSVTLDPQLRFSVQYSVFVLSRGALLASLRGVGYIYCLFYMVISNSRIFDTPFHILDVLVDIF